MEQLRADLLHTLGGWTLLQQFEEIAESIRLHRISGTKYPATDRELRLLGLLVAFQLLEERPGSHRFPSGAIAHIGPDLNSEACWRVEGQVLPSDLPPMVGDHVERMPLEAQAERERLLPILSRQIRAERAGNVRFLRAVGSKTERRHNDDDE